MTTEIAPVPDQRNDALVDDQDELDALDFQQILAQPVLAYDEGLRFFRGRGLMNRTLNKLARDLESRGIDYAVIGAVALNQHGYQRFTTDIDLLMTPEGLEQFISKLVGLDYRPAFAGARKKFRATEENVPIEIVTSGEYPGDGKPKAIVFPNPTDVSIEINGIQTVTLEKLIELKLASGMTGQGRRKDLGDVQELIRTLNLGADIADRIDSSVRALYLELYGELVASEQDELAPDAESE